MVAQAEAVRINAYAQDRFRTYIQGAMASNNNVQNLRASFLERDRIYQRELDWTAEHLRARAANLSGNAIKMQNVVVPVVMPQVEAVHGFMVDTFLSSYPVFPVVSGPEYMPVAQQIDAVMGESAVRFQYVKHLAMAIRDGLKYNLMAVEVAWKNLKVYSVVNEPKQDIVFGVPVETEFSGNVLKRLDPYNLVLDPRVAPSEVHEKGDFAGYVELMTRIQLKNLFLELDPTLTMNAEEAFTSNGMSTTGTMGTGSAISPYYVPQVNPSVLQDATFLTQDWLNWASLDTQDKVRTGAMYEIATMYVRIIPRDFGVNTGKDRAMNGVPQIFKLIFVNSQVMIYCERMSNAHSYLPIIIGQPNEDGLRYQTKSFADNAAPYQFLSSALYNSAITSQRRKVYDRIFYDPTKINKSDIDKVDPVARIPVKTSAYGKPLSDAFEVAPYRDDGIPNILAMAREVTEMADVSTGQNRVQRGQFQKGNKTLHEFDTVMDKSDMRPRSMAIVLESSWFQPIKYVLKMNILQYQPPAQLYNQNTQKMVQVTPSQLRSVAWQFQVADGVLPVSKLLNPELYTQVVQLAMANPQFATSYDLVGMGVYNLKLAGASWIDAFKITDPKAQQQNAQAAAGPQENPDGSTKRATPAATP